MDQPKMSPTEIASFIQLALKLLDAVKESGLLKAKARGRRSSTASPAARKAAAERMRQYRAAKAAQAAAPKAKAPEKKKVRKAPKAANPLANVPTETAAAG